MGECLNFVSVGVTKHPKKNLREREVSFCFVFSAQFKAQIIMAATSRWQELEPRVTFIHSQEAESNACCCLT